MGRSEAEIQEEWTFGGRHLMDVIRGVSGQCRHDRIQSPSGYHASGMPVHRIRFISIRLLRQPVVVDESIRWIVRHIVSEIVIEATGDRTIVDGFGKIDLLFDGQPACDIRIRVVHRIADQSALFQRPVPAQMPFANAGRGVSCILEQTTHRVSVCFDQRGIILPGYAFFQTSAPCIAPGEETVTRGCAQ